MSPRALQSSGGDGGGGSGVSLTLGLVQECVDHFRAAAEHAPPPLVAESAHPVALRADCVARVG